MHDLKDILYGVNILAVSGSTEQSAEQLTFDSRTAKENSIFFAIVGSLNDGHDYIQNVIEAGCKVLVVSKKIEAPKNVTVIEVKDTYKALAIMASNFYGEPSKELKLIGITGTNGKTTIATLLYQLFSKLEFQTGLISTVVN